MLNVSSHRFPTSKFPFHNDWIQIIQHQLNNPLFMPKKNSYVCINHFEEHNFNRSKRRLRLRAGSKPTLFNNASEAKQVFTEKKTI